MSGMCGSSARGWGPRTRPAAARAGSPRGRSRAPPLDIPAQLAGGAHARWTRLRPRYIIEHAASERFRCLNMRSTMTQPTSDPAATPSYPYETHLDVRHGPLEVFDVQR